MSFKEDKKPADCGLFNAYQNGAASSSGSN